MKTRLSTPPLLDTGASEGDGADTPLALRPRRRTPPLQGFSAARHRLRSAFVLAAGVGALSIVLSGCAREDAYEAGTAAFERSDFRTAVDRLERYVKEHPQHYKARVTLARAYAARRDWDRAHRQLAIAREQDPGTAEDLYWQAQAFLDEGKLNLARQEFEAARGLFEKGTGACSALLTRRDSGTGWELNGALELHLFLTSMAASRELIEETFGPEATQKRLFDVYEALYSSSEDRAFQKQISTLIAELQEEGFGGATALYGYLDAARRAFKATIDSVKKALSTNSKLSSAALSLAQINGAIRRRKETIEACQKLFDIPEEGDRAEVSRIRRDKVAGHFLLANVYLEGAGDKKKRDPNEGTRDDTAGPGAEDGPKPEVDDERRDPEAAMRELQAVLAIEGVSKSDEIDARARLCELYFQAADFTDMAIEAQKLHKLDRTHPAANLFRGLAAEREGRAELAVDWIQQGLTGAYEDLPDGHLTLARALFALNKHGPALDAVSRCLKSDPARREARKLRAEIFIHQKWYGDAQSEIESLLLEDRTDVRLQAMLRELEARRIGNDPGRPRYETLESAQAALARDRSSTCALYRMAELLLEQGDTLGAGRPARALVDAAPTSYLAQQMLGRVYLATRDFAKAERAFSRAITLQPLLPECYGDLGRALVAEGKFARGRKQLKAGLRRDPFNLPIAVDLANLFVEKGRPAQAGTILKKLALRDPIPPEARNLEGDITLAKGDAEKAYVIFRSLLDERPEFALPWLGLARCFERRGERSRAIDSLNRFLLESAKKPELLAQREAAYRLLLGMQLEARLADAALITAREMRREFGDAGASTVFASFFLGRRDDRIAGSHCRLGLASASDDATLHLIAGDVAERVGNRQKAIDEWTRAVDSDPSLGRAHVHLADAYRQAGKTKQASLAYQKAIRMNSKAREVYEGLVLLLPAPTEARSLDRAFARLTKHREGPTELAGFAALKARIALYKGDRAAAETALDAVATEGLSLEDRAAVALLRIAAGNPKKAAAAFDGGADSAAAPHLLRTTALVLAAIEQRDLGAAEAVCAAFLGLASEAKSSAGSPDDPDVESAGESLRGRRVVRELLACVRVIQGRADDAVSEIEQAFTGDERRDLRSLLRLLGANADLSADVATRLARVLAYRSSPFTQGLAEPEADAMRKAVPGQPLPYLILAELALERGALKAAERLLGESSERNTDHAPSYVRRARMLVEDGRFKEAWELLLRASTSCPESLDVQVALGDGATRARKLGLRAKLPSEYYARALELARSEGADAPSMARLHAAMTRSLKGAGTEDAAIEHAREALAAVPRDFRLKLQLGQLLLAKKDPQTLEEITGLATSMTQAFPTRPEGYLLLARIHRKQRNLEEARVVLEKCLRDVDPFDVPCRLELAAVLAPSQGESTSDELDAEERAIVLLDPGQIEIHRALAGRALRASNAEALAEAERHLKEALLFKRDDRESLIAYLELAMRRKDWKIASLAAARARNVFGGDPEIRYLAGKCFHDQGRESEALSEYLEAARLKPGDPRVHLGLAEIYNARGMTDDAIAEAKLVLDSDPNAEEAKGAQAILKVLDPAPVQRRRNPRNPR